MAEDGWEEAAAEVRQDADQRDARQSAERARLTRYKAQNMQLVAAIDKAVRQYLDVVMRHQGQYVVQGKQIAQEQGRPTLVRVSTAADLNPVNVVTSATHVEWMFYNSDYPQGTDDQLRVHDYGWWRIEHARRTSHGGQDDWDFDFIAGYNDKNRLDAIGDKALDPKYLSESMQIMAAFLTACGLPLPS